jgi:protein SCO1/2
MKRREFLRSMGVSMFRTLAVAKQTMAAPGGPATGARFPDVILTTHDGRRVRFGRDLVKGRCVLINFMYATCTDSCPTYTANLVRVQRLLGNRLGRDIFMYSITLDPEHDTPAVLRDYIQAYGVRPGWTFLTGAKADIELLRRRLGFRDVDPVVDADKTQHIGVVLFGNDRFDRWGACPALSEATEIVKSVTWVAGPRRSAGRPVGGGPVGHADAAREARTVKRARGDALIVRTPLCC